MDEQIEHLEDRIGKVVERLRGISRDREALRGEVRALQAEIERRNDESEKAALSAGTPIDRDAVLSTLRNALVELRAE